MNRLQNFQTTLRSYKYNKQVVAVIIIGLIVIGIFIITSHGASGVVSIESENATITKPPITKGNDPNASNGQFIQFDQVPPPPAADPVIAAAGDIACDPTDPQFNNTNGGATNCHMRATSDLFNVIKPQAVVTLGDNQYEAGGNLNNILKSYDPTWGRFNNITKSTIGNHEGGEGGSTAGYFSYFGPAAGDPNTGYYSWDLGSWHLIALNSNCGTYVFNGSKNGCENGSPQEIWLKNDLASHHNVCTLAYWHVPRFSSGSSHHNDASTDTVYTAFWNDLYNGGAELVLNGHDHDYERFGPLRPDGTVDTARGIREFIVGTGGKNHYSFTSVVQGSEVRDIGTYGVLKLTLHATSYDWEFVPEAGKSFIDKGSGNCH